VCRRRKKILLKRRRLIEPGEIDRRTYSLSLKDVWVWSIVVVTINTTRKTAEVAHYSVLKKRLT
jgi:hypothetical protein